MVVCTTIVAVVGQNPPEVEHWTNTDTNVVKHISRTVGWEDYIFGNLQE
jgi:hypothetical protein